MINSLSNTISMNNTVNNFSFKGQYTTIGMPLLKKFRNVTCIYCGQPMWTYPEICEFAKKGQYLRGFNLIKFFQDLKKQMKPNEKNATWWIIESLKKNTGDNLQEIMDRLYPLQLRRLESKQETIFENINRISKKFSPHDRALTLTALNMGRDWIYSHRVEAPFKRKKFIQDIFETQEYFQDYGNFLTVLNESLKLPTTYNSEAALLVKYKRTSPYKTINRLCNTNQVTIEHLLPRSKGGTSILPNMALACKFDNYRRSNSPLDSMSSFVRFLPKYFGSLRKAAAESGKLSPDKLELIEKESIEGVKSTINGLLKDGLRLNDSSKGRYF